MFAMVQSVLDLIPMVHRLICENMIIFDPGVAPARLIAAWGDSETISYHGTQFGKAEVIMFGGQEGSNIDPLLDLKSNPSVSFFDVLAVSDRPGSTPPDRGRGQPEVLAAAAMSRAVALQQRNRQVLTAGGLLRTPVKRYGFAHAIFACIDESDEIRVHALHNMRGAHAYVAHQTKMAIRPFRNDDCMFLCLFGVCISSAPHRSLDSTRQRGNDAEKLHHPSKSHDLRRLLLTSLGAA